jgi:hypothetical protein
MRTTKTVRFFFVRQEENSIGANPPPEDPLPLLSLERLYVSLKRIGCHLVQSACNAFLDLAWEIFQVFLGGFGKLTDPGHASLGSSAGFCLPSPA